MDHTADHSQAQHMLTTARTFARERIDPEAARWERERRLPREVITAAAAAGLCGLLVPTELGGAGLGVSEMAEVMAALAYADMGLAFSLVSHNNLAGGIAKNGSNRQRAQYLDAMLDGSTLGAFLLTESGTGSDAAAITTSAIATGDRWMLNGEKAWITNATGAELLSVYAQTEPGAGLPRHRRIPRAGRPTGRHPGGSLRDARCPRHRYRQLPIRQR